MNDFEMCNYPFDGAYLSPDQLQPNPGVYVVLDKDDDNWTVLDVGESENIKRRLKNHNRESDWQRHRKGTFYYAATYIQDKNYGYDKARRHIVERYIRSVAKPLCGER